MPIMDALVAYWVCISAVAAGAVLYTLLKRRLANLAQPMRLKMATAGIELLRSNISEKDKNIIAFMMANAYSSLPSFLFVILFPITLAQIAWHYLVGGKKSSQDGPPNEEAGKFTGQFMLSTFAANPIIAAVAIVELLSLGFLCFLVGGQMLLFRALFATQKAETRNGKFWWNNSQRQAA